MRHAEIGLIVKTWNTGEWLRRCLDAIIAASPLPREIAVVDLGEDELSHVYARDLAERHDVRLQWLPIGHRLAPGIANRRALEALSTRLIGLLDDDIVVPRNWLGPLTSILLDPGVGLVAPIRPDPFLAYPGRDESTEGVLDDLKKGLEGIPDLVKTYTHGRSLEDFGREVQRVNDLPRELAVEFPSFLSSCCLGISRGAIEAAGGIADPVFSAGYGSEDVDLTWRVLQAGYAAIRTSDVFVLHFRHTSLEANHVDYATELAAANRLLYARWRKQLLTWGRDRLRRGDDRDDLTRRFIVRELFRNTEFDGDLFRSSRR
ncbi:MAG TPA: glycosyltransferase [Chloroflexota bacterium]|nr:glycosyltransferase [Chloroflexota bacterium]